MQYKANAMKQVVALFLIPIYLMLNLGIQVNRHYCGGKLASVNLFVGKGKCACGETEMPAGCCKDENKIYQIEDDQQKIAFSFDLLKVTLFKFTPPAPVFEWFTFQNYVLSFHDSLAVIWQNPPLPPLKTPLYLRNNVLRI